MPGGVFSPRNITGTERTSHGRRGSTANGATRHHLHQGEKGKGQCQAGKCSCSQLSDIPGIGEGHRSHHGNRDHIRRRQAPKDFCDVSFQEELSAWSVGVGQAVFPMVGRSVQAAFQTLRGQRYGTRRNVFGIGDPNRQAADASLAARWSVQLVPKTIRMNGQPGLASPDVLSWLIQLTPDNDSHQSQWISDRS